MSHIKNGGRITAGVLGFVCTLAVAFFIGNYLGDGQHTGTLGSGGNGSKTLPINVSFEDGLTPTKSVPLTATVNNNSGKTVEFTGLSATVTTSVEACLPQWFKITSNKTFFTELLSGKPSELEYAPGSSPVGNPVGVETPTTFKIEMVETSVDQSACESASVTVQMKLTGGTAV